MARYSAHEGESREKAKSPKPLRELARFCRPYKLQIVLSGIALAFTATLALVLPIAIRRIVDSFGENSGRILDDFLLAAVLLAALFAIGTAMRYALVNRLGERIVADIRKQVFGRVLGMSPGFYERNLTGEVLSRLTTDTTLILTVVSSSATVALRFILIFAGGLVLMVVTSPKLTVLALVVVPAAIIPAIALGRRLRRQSRDSQDRIADSFGGAFEALSSVQTVQAFTNEKRVQTRFESATDAARETAFRRITTRAILTAIMIFSVFASIAIMLWVGARDVNAGTMSPGELVQFMIYSVMVASSVAALSEIWGEILRAAGASERLAELLSAIDAIQDPIDPVRLPVSATGHIAFESVSFQYPARPDSKALFGVSFEAHPGETIALVGPSGAGKSTIFNLILRFFDPESGRILFNGKDLRSMARSDFREAISLVDQDVAVFATSVRENIRFGRGDASDRDIEAAARAAAAHEFIMDLPDGYDTLVGERGVLLSAGQRQRIAIARAVIRDAQLLLLDEATSALDSENERVVQSATESLSESKTTIIVAHRLSTVQRADRIFVFERGRITAEGTHETLLAEGELYARLAALQFTGT
ncbi:MAG: ABC transporter transmembrane domain-containing protein [Albidovulum sp.]|nr:ABC transporter transmembrane domain-containing protein [Albidovulum sp.]